MEVDVQIQAAEALHAEHRPALNSVKPIAFGPRAIAGENGLDEDARERRQHVGLERGELAELEGERQHVLPDRHIGQHAIDQVGRPVGHPPPAAARADTATVTGEGDEQIVATRVAVSARKPLREESTRQVAAELSLHVARNASLVVFAGVLEEGLEVLADQRIEDCLCRSPWRIRGSEGRHEPAFAQGVPGSNRAKTPHAGQPAPCPRIWRRWPRTDDGVCSVAPVTDRRALRAALLAIGTHRAGLLVVAKRDRVARDVMLAAEVERAAARAGARLVSATGEGNGNSPADAFMRIVIDGAAQYEHALIRARTRAALAAKRARGERVGALPYGFGLDPGSVRLVAVEREQTAITRARRLRAMGLSLRAIASQLAVEGFLSRSGRTFFASQVSRMLVGPATATACP